MISLPDLLGCLYQTKVKTAAKPMGSHFLMTAHFPPGKVYGPLKLNKFARNKMSTNNIFVNAPIKILNIF